MSFNDDTCDFCHSYVDPIGGDLARVTGKGFWCGVCREGRDAMYGELSTDDVIELRDKLKAEYDADPIDWTDYPKEKTPEGYRAHLHRLDLMDMVGHMNAVLSDRRTTAEGQP